MRGWGGGGVGVRVGVGDEDNLEIQSSEQKPVVEPARRTVHTRSPTAMQGADLTQGQAEENLCN